MSNLGAPHLHLHLARVPGSSGCANVRRAWIRTRTEMHQYVWICIYKYIYIYMCNIIYIYIYIYMCVCDMRASFWALTLADMRYHKHLEKQTFAYFDSQRSLSALILCATGLHHWVGEIWCSLLGTWHEIQLILVHMCSCGCEHPMLRHEKIMPTLLTLSSPLECCQACKLMH